MRPSRFVQLVLAALAGVFVYFVAMRDARAVPSFARKYQTSCQTCHTVYPALNPFGEAFRRNGYRFPSQGGSTDLDQVKSEMIPLGQDEYKAPFPDAGWPDKSSRSFTSSRPVHSTTTSRTSARSRCRETTARSTSSTAICCGATSSVRGTS
jgi:hypothetical protein